MTGPQDPYQILEIPYGSTPSTVKHAWRAAARKWHPDTNPDNPDEAAARFADAKAAYELLMATLGPVEKPAPSGPAGPTEPAAAEPVAHPEGTVLHDPFAAHAGPTRKGDDVTATVTADLGLLIFGGPGTAYMSYVVPCPACAGTGAAGCECGGTGTRTVNAHQGITVPAGTSDGATIRLPRRGGPGWGGGAPGDLTVRIRMAPDPVWTANGRDLAARLSITTATALAGARLRLPHPRGPVDVNVPAGSLDGYTLVIPTAGITGDGTVTVRATPLDLADPGVQHALSELDRAERQSARSK